MSSRAAAAQHNPEANLPVGPHSKPRHGNLPAGVRLCGNSVRRRSAALVVRDPEADAGFRAWSTRDTEALYQWVNESRQPEPIRPLRVCHNLKQTAEIL